MRQGTANKTEGDRLVRFIGTKGINPFVKPELAEVIKTPIRFYVPTGGLAYGYEATVLADLCDAVLEARKTVKLNYQQDHIAARCEILVRSFARVGIIALVDEATGYQYDRARDALAKLLEAFVAKELQAWVKTFPADFYEQMFRLRGLDFPADTIKRPQYFGVLTNDIVIQAHRAWCFGGAKASNAQGRLGTPQAQILSATYLQRRLSKATGTPWRGRRDHEAQR